MAAVKFKTNFASFPKVSHNGATALRFNATSSMVALS